ncbi:MAG: SUF system NifU family Fe-S cluster assembly protein [Bacilli bacterium]|jgi:nitrogen fixation NifU-like protein
MPTFLNPVMMRQIIMDHYENPRNKKQPSSEGYISMHMNSANCIDDIDVFLKIVSGYIVDACFDGVACTISTSSTDIMCDLLKGKTIKDAQYIIEQYLNMISEKQFDESVLDEAIVFVNTSKQAARIKCATIGWTAADSLLDKK